MSRYSSIGSQVRNRNSHRETADKALQTVCVPLDAISNTFASRSTITSIAFDVINSQRAVEITYLLT